MTTDVRVGPKLSVLADLVKIIKTPAPKVQPISHLSRI